MSIDIHWSTLTDGPDGNTLAEGVRAFIHDKFQEVTLPRFIRSVKVHSFDFGSVAPEIEIKDICDPLPDFYEEDETYTISSNEEERGAAEESPLQEASAGTSIDLSHQNTSSKRQTHTDSKSHSTSHAPLPPYVDRRLPGLRTTLAPAEQLGSPLFPRTPTPGIPGGTSNLSYFHLPLTGLSGTTTPLAAVAGAQFHTGWADHSSQARQNTIQGLSQHPNISTSSPTPPSTADPNSRPSSEHVRQASRDSNDGMMESQSHHDQDSSCSLSPPPPRMREKSVEDVQVVSRVKYSGDVKLSLTAEILLDYPMPSFVGIPLKLNITGLSFDGIAILAYIRNRAHVCFLSPEDADALLEGDVDLFVNSGEQNNKEQPTNRRSETGGLLEEIRVESEIGQKENGKQVLKNVGKVERFVLEQVRRILEDEFVYPSFWTFLV